MGDKDTGLGHSPLMKLFSISASCLLVLLLSVVVPPAVEAQDPEGGVIRGARLDVHGNLSLPHLFGAGVRVDIPIVPDGVLRRVQDEIALSPGAEMMFFRPPRGDDDEAGWGLWPVLAVQWNFYFQRHWSAFPELGVAGFAYYRPYGSAVVPFASLGLRYHFNRRNALLFRIGFPSGLQVGITL